MISNIDNLLVVVDDTYKEVKFKDVSTGGIFYQTRINM